MAIVELKKHVLKIIFRYIPDETVAVFLFGSHASNNVYPSSDIDIGVVSGKPIQNSILVKIKEGLQEVKTLRDIDVVDFSSLQDKSFLKTALKEIKIWHKTKTSGIYLSNLRKRIAG